ncbi:hypothetical protein WME73_46265 [Sorangium sp. So ce302]
MQRSPPNQARVQPAAPSPGAAPSAGRSRRMSELRRHVATLAAARVL